MANELSSENKSTVVAMLCEGSSIRAIERITGIHEVFQGKTVWQGDVEVFDLHGHPKAKCAYAWSHIDGPNDERGAVRCRAGNPPG